MKKIYFFQDEVRLRNAADLEQRVFIFIKKFDGEFAGGRTAQIDDDVDILPGVYKFTSHKSGRRWWLYFFLLFGSRFVWNDGNRWCSLSGINYRPVRF